jgi:hypothetical protein
MYEEIAISGSPRERGNCSNDPNLAAYPDTFSECTDNRNDKTK